MHAAGVGHSDVGRERQRNEDSWYGDDDLGLFIVADGMGGHAGGDVASALSVETIRAQLAAYRAEHGALSSDRLDRKKACQLVEDAVKRACAVVYEKATAEPELAGMGCTTTLIWHIDNYAVMGHVGDSRLYLLRDGAISQLSSDHTLANQLVTAGVMSAEEAVDHDYSHVLSRALGTQATVDVDTLAFDVLPGDRFLLCSDGFGDYIKNEAWLGNELKGDDLELRSEELVAYANAAGGHDNITVLLVDVHADEPELEIVDEMSGTLQIKMDAVNSVFMFEELSLSMASRVLSHCEIVGYAPDDVVVQQGDELRELMVVVSGLFHVTRDDAPIGGLRYGMQVGGTTLLRPRPAEGTLTCVTSGSVLILRRDEFWQLIRSRPWLGLGLLERWGREMSANLDEISDEQRALGLELAPDRWL